MFALITAHYGKRLAILGFSLWIGLCQAQASQPESQRFEAGSLAEILATHQGQPFLLVLWSIDCPPCIQELELLAQMQDENPKLNLVLISTDNPEAEKEVGTVLKKRGLKEVESWIFSGANAQQLRYEIDPAWYGEIPRSYFYDPEHERVAVSGALERDQIRAWLKAVQL
jgi:thiol-disulfide isomerase/thioredoxin